MIRIFCTLIFIISFSKLQAEDELYAIRNLLYRAEVSSLAADSMYNYLNTFKVFSKPELIGYKGMASFMICFHSNNPYSKYKHFLNGKMILENAIKAYPNNIELRFLRLSVQLNVPSFLGYSNNIDSDKFVIFNGIKNIRDKDLLERIYKYSLSAKKISVQEKKLIQESYNSNKFIN